MLKTLDREVNEHGKEKVVAGKFVCRRMSKLLNGLMCGRGQSACTSRHWRYPVCSLIWARLCPLTSYALSQLVSYSICLVIQVPIYKNAHITDIY
jgi:hypothetical protein